MKTKISIAKESDLIDLVLLLNDLFNQDEEFEPNEQLQKSGLLDILKNKNIGEILVLKVENEIIGMVSLLYSISTVLGGKVAILEDMIIKQKYRKSGYGTILFKEAMEYAKNVGCLRITLLTDRGNEVAQKFYESFGFKKSPMLPMRLVF